MTAPNPGRSAKLMLPEAGTLPLLLAGLAVLGWVARRRVF